MQIFQKICLALVIIGGLNWGLVGIFQFNLVAWLFGGSLTLLSRVIFAVVGIAALCLIPALFGNSGQPQGNGTAE